MHEPPPDNVSPTDRDANEVEKADVEIGLKIARHRDEPAVKAASFAGKIGDQGPLYAIASVVLLYGLAKRDRRLAGAAVTMLAAVGAADAGKSLTKRLVKRTRPHVLLDEQRYKSEAGGSEKKTDQSFPSGHTAGSVAFSRALSRSYPKAGAVSGVAAIAIAASRLAKGAHWPLDVGAGAVIGLLGEAVTSRILQLVARAFFRSEEDA